MTKGGYQKLSPNTQIFESIKLNFLCFHFKLFKFLKDSLRNEETIIRIPLKKVLVFHVTIEICNRTWPIHIQRTYLIIKGKCHHLTALPTITTPACTEGNTARPPFCLASRGSSAASQAIETYCDPEINQLWPEPSRPPVSPLEERLRESSWPPRLPGSPPPPLEGWRSPTGTGPALWLSGRSGDTRSQLSCSSARLVW